jgi:DNA-binding CsgD family transcriptional regulator
LGNLCRSLGRVFQDGDAPPPVLKVQNPWGTFVFRAYWMEPGAEGSRIGVTVQHRDSLPVALVAGMKPLRLSPKQKEVALLLALGETHQTIARRMNVSLNTANYHVKQVYDKLDAHDRKDVLRTLLPRSV